MKKLRLWLWRRLLESGCLVVSVHKKKHFYIVHLWDQKRRLDITTRAAYPFICDDEWIIV